MDQKQTICPCCERPRERVRYSPWHTEEPICNYCFMVWYDMGYTTKEKIKEFVLKAEKEGAFPFTVPGQASNAA